MTRPVIGLLTDFGTRDWYVGALKAVILSRCPRAQLIDITHEIPPQDLLAGALTLAAVALWFPPRSVILAVVDPGVGTDRAILAARMDGRYLVGPDNGLLALSLAQARRVSVTRVANRRYWLSVVSQTFQARDIMAPVAAALASGQSLSRLGPAMRQVTPLALPAVQATGRALRGSVVHVDAFGNLITNLPATVLTARRGGESPTLQYQHRRVRVVSSYAAGRPRELVAIAGSLGFVELAVRDGSAARTCRAARGDAVRVLLGRRQAMTASSCC